MRISTNHFYSNVLGSIQKEYLGAARAHEQVASGQRINRLSEDPAALSQILSLRTSTSEIDNYLMSMDQQISRLNRAEEALAQAVDVLHDVRDITVQGSTETYSQSDLQNLAFQVDQAITAIVGFANTTLGKITPQEMFTRETITIHGEETEVVLYKPPAMGDAEDVDGQGWGRVLTLHMLVSTIDPASTFNIDLDQKYALVDDKWTRVAEYNGKLVSVNADGTPYVYVGKDDDGKLISGVGGDQAIEMEDADIAYRATMFDTLFQLRDALRGEGNLENVSPLLEDFDQHLDTLVQGRSDLGSRAYQLEKLSRQVGVQKEQLTEVLSKVGDTDVAEATIRLSRHDLVLRATLLTATRLMDISLLNYLR